MKKPKMIPMTENQIENIADKGIDPRMVAQWLYEVRKSLREINTKNLVLSSK